MCGLIDSVSVVGDALTVPRRPVWLRFVERPLAARRKQFKRRVWVPSVLPVGPKRPPLPWDDVLDDLIKAESQLHGSDRNAMVAVHRVDRRLTNHTMKEAAGQVSLSPRSASPEVYQKHELQYFTSLMSTIHS